ncbi:response regulator [Hydrogenispora ethanolica]|uniref:response regulator n=1 Tax=Hydrogenispora ethanolica TaxID=1082276 RepID=UPI00104B4800|nr:response regulator transcription factor [Hydrogenispora ethanolica]
MTAKIRIMVVDDTWETCNNLQRLLELEEDIQVVGTASNGEEALRFAKVLLPDIVLMDINMPVMNGIQTTEQMTIELPQTAIIMLSVQAEQEYIRQAKAAGASEYLIKPPSIEALTQAVRRVYLSKKSR